MMSLKKIVLLVLCALSTLFVDAQSISAIKTSGRYYWAEGKGKTIKEAENQALQGILHQISVKVTSDFTSVEREKTQGTACDSETEVQQIISSYSTATLTNLHRIIEKEKTGHIELICFIDEAELNKIFQQRVEKVLTLLADAEESLESLQIDDALRNFYWGLALVKSLRYPNEAKTANGQLLYTYIPKRIEDVLSRINLWAEQDEDSDTDFTLYATYNGSTISTMEYTYFDGQDYSGIYQINNGCGVLEMRPPVVAKNIKVKIEYIFQDFNTDREVEDVLKVEEPVIFKGATKTVQLKGKVKKKEIAVREEVKEEIAETTETRQALNILDSTFLYTVKVDQVAAAIASSSYADLPQLFTEQGWKEFNTIKSYGRIKLNNSYKVSCMESENSGEIVCRGLGCTFYFSHGKSFAEEMTFMFGPDGKINHVALGLGGSLEAEIISQTAWSEASRKTIISFLEGYRTAYAMKDIDYMQTVLDDNAVIIVGTRVASAPHLNDKSLLSSDCVVRTQKTKQEFIESLTRSFKSKEYINLHFEKCSIMKLREGEERYGIQIKQDYYSSNYGDTGYLYLLVDLTKPKEPVIHVRTWQEMPDAELGIIGPGTF